MKSALLLVISFFVAVYFGIVALLALWTDRNMDFWVSYIKGETIDVNYWWSFLLTLIAPIGIVGNTVSEILRVIVT